MVNTTIHYFALSVMKDCALLGSRPNLPWLVEAHRQCRYLMPLWRLDRLYMWETSQMLSEFDDETPSIFARHCLDAASWLCGQSSIARSACSR